MATTAIDPNFSYSLKRTIDQLVSAKTKDKFWAAEMSEIYYFNYGNCYPLTRDKNVPLLRSYANGNQDVSRIKKSLFKLTESSIEMGAMNQGTNLPRGTATKIAKKDLTGIEWEPVAILPNMINSAKTNLIKQPLNPTCTAIDPLAKNQKLEDAMKIRYNKFVQEDLDKLAKKIGVQLEHQKDLKYTDVTASIESLDLDPMNDDELQLYQEMFTKLSVEAAMETFLDYDTYKNKMSIIKNLILDDHYVLGVSVYEKFMNKITGLMDAKYYDPQTVFAPPSVLPDKSDVPFIYVADTISLEEFMKRFPDEVGDLSQQIELFTAVCKCNRLNWTWYGTDPYKRSQIQIPLVRMQVKAWDGKKSVTKKSATGVKYTEIKDVDYEAPEGDKNRTVESYWKQCTYDWYYLPCNRRVYGFQRLDATYNTYGNEAMSSFSLNIYESAKRSPVERVKVLVDNFQRAFFKAQHALLKSRPAGYHINIKHLRNAAENLKEDGYDTWGLLEMFFQENILIGDSGDFNDKEVYNNPAINEIKGTNMREVLEYWNIMAQIKAEIREVTGINDTRDAATPNADALVGIQKLALEASINATFYIDDAMKHTIEDGYRYSACLISYILRPENKGTPPYEALMAFAGRIKTSIIDAAGRLHMHQYGIKVENVTTEAQRAFTQSLLLQMVKEGKLDYADIFAITHIQNYKDAEALAIIRQRKKEMQRRKEAQAGFEAAAANTDKTIQSKEKMVQAQVMGGIEEHKVDSGSSKYVADLNAKLDILLQSQKIRATGAQNQQKSANKIQEKVVEKKLEEVALP
jgi:hypothetical protein